MYRIQRRWGPSACLLLCLLLVDLKSALPACVLADYELAYIEVDLVYRLQHRWGAPQGVQGPIVIGHACVLPECVLAHW